MITASRRIDHIINDKDPLSVAKLYADEHDRLVLFWQDDGYQWTGTHWKPVENSAVVQSLYFWGDGKLTPSGQFRPTRRWVEDTLHAVRAVLRCDASSAPAWLCEITPNMPAAERLITCANGLLDPVSRTLLAPTPHYFTQNALDFPYDPYAPVCREFISFLETLWPNDSESIEALQEWFGLLLTVDTRHQKALLLVGPRRSGKGTIARILTALIGLGNVTAPTLSGLGSDFGLESLIGKMLALMSDVRLGGRSDVGAIVENILRVSGEDTISVRRKHRVDFTARLRVRFVLLSNEVPALLDQSGALAGRFIVLRLTRSFFGQEDLGLTERLLSELPGILLWALDGLDRLRARGYLLQPSSALAMVRQLENLASPIKSFAAERCVIGPGASVECAELFDAWKTWAREQGRDHAGTLQIFGRNLAAAFPEISVTQPRSSDGTRRRHYEGIRVRAAWENEDEE